MNFLAALGLALGAYAYGRKTTARVPSREVPRRPRTLESVVGLPPRLSLEARKAAVVDIVQSDRQFKPDIAARLLQVLARSGAETLETDEQGALLFRMGPLGHRSALDLAEEAWRRGADVYLSLACVLPLTQAQVPRVIAVAEAGKRPPVVASRFYFARLVKPEPKTEPAQVLGSVLVPPDKVNGAYTKVEVAPPQPEPAPKSA